MVILDFLRSQMMKLTKQSKVRPIKLICVPSVEGFQAYVGKQFREFCAKKSYFAVIPLIICFFFSFSNFLYLLK
jgi:hypothetical protein